MDLLLNSDIDEHVDFYRIKTKDNQLFTVMKMISKANKNQPAQFLITSIKASKAEIIKYFPSEKVNKAFDYTLN